MPTKALLIDTILAETALAQEPESLAARQPREFRFPPTLPIGDGRFILATDRLLDAVAEFADILSDNNGGVAASYTKKDLRNLVRKAFGQALAPIELDDPVEINREKVLHSVTEFLHTALDREANDQQFVFGSWYLQDGRPHAIKIGPVRIEDRATWLVRARLEGHVSHITERRLARLWEGRKLVKRASSFDEDREISLVDALGSCPDVCSVETRGLVAQAAEQKALLAARLAHTAVALLWISPSSVLDRLGLLYDNDFRRQHYVTFGAGESWGASSSVSRLPSGPVKPENWPEMWAGADWLIGPIGQALWEYVDPGRQTTRPKIMNALFLSLWWFHDACLERSPLMATVKYASAMDVLANGGKRRGIVRFIEAQRGAAYRGTAILSGGQTPDELVAEIYDYARSRTVHGSNKRIGHDWTQTRSRAEMLARLCLLMACAWITDHPDADDVEGMQMPGNNAAAGSR